MSLADLTRAAVEQAIREYDQLGRKECLGQPGFGESSDHLLLHNGKTYDANAIAVAAHRFVAPDAAQLRGDEFSGGAAAVAARLRELGFRVIGPGDALGPVLRLPQFPLQRVVCTSQGVVTISRG